MVSDIHVTHRRDESSRRSLLRAFVAELVKHEILAERRIKFQEALLSLTGDDAVKLGLGTLTLFGGYHSGEAFKAKCQEWTEKIKADPSVDREPWVQELWDEKRQEVVPRRRIFLYRLSEMPAAWEIEDEAKAAMKERGMGEDEKKTARWNFARLLASTDNMQGKEAVSYDANTIVMLLMIWRREFENLDKPDRATGRASKGGYKQFRYDATGRCEYVL
jgi:hypothetical protein